MFWNAKNGRVLVDDSEMSYVSFGNGNKKLILIPGLSDGLTTVKGKAIFLARPYKCFFKQYTVYIFSRKEHLPKEYSIQEMAEDQAKAMRILGMKKTHVLGVSQGGMIAQYLAADHPELVEKLVIAVSAPKINQKIRACLNQWIGYAERGRHKKLMISTAEKSYSEDYQKKYRHFYPILGILGKPSDYGRFITNAKAILEFDASSVLQNIKCPTLIVGGEEDQITGAQASYDLHFLIPGSELFMYKGLGHAAYEEAEDFYQRVFMFLEKN